MPGTLAAGTDIRLEQIGQFARHSVARPRARVSMVHPAPDSAMGGPSIRGCGHVVGRELLVGLAGRLRRSWSSLRSAGLAGDADKRRAGWWSSRKSGPTRRRRDQRAGCRRRRIGLAGLTPDQMVGAASPALAAEGSAEVAAAGAASPALAAERSAEVAAAGAASPFVGARLGADAGRLDSGRANHRPVWVGHRLAVDGTGARHRGRRLRGRRLSGRRLSGRARPGVLAARRACGPSSRRASWPCAGRRTRRRTPALTAS